MRIELAIRKQPLIPPRAVAIWAYCLSALLCITALIAGALLAFMQGQAITGILVGSAGIFLLWYLTESMIESPAGLTMLYHLSKGNFRQIERAHGRAASLIRVLPIRKGQSYARILLNQGLMRMSLGDFERAEVLMRDAIAILRRLQNSAEYPHRYRHMLLRFTPTFEPEPNLLKSDLFAIASNNLASLLVRKGEFDEAEDLAKNAREIYQAGKFRSPNAVLFPATVLGLIELEREHFHLAEQQFREALELCSAEKLPLTILAQSAEYTRTACLLALALSLYKQDKKQQGDEVLDDLTGQLSENRNSLSINTVYILSRLTHELIAHQDYKRAEPLLELAYAIAGDYPDHPNAALVMESYTQLLSLTDRQSELADLKSWIRPVLIGMNG